MSAERTEKKIASELQNLEKAWQKRPEPGPFFSHGARSFLATGKIPEQFPHVIEEAANLRLGLLSDEAGLDGDLPAKRLAILDSAIRSFVVARLLFDDVLRNGIHQKKGKGERIRDSIKTLATYENTLRLSLQALGLERRQREIPDLQAYLKAQRADQEEGSI